MVRKPIVNRQDLVEDEEITLQYKYFDRNKPGHGEGRSPFAFADGVLSSTLRDYSDE
jgi:hypothetical protein